MPRKNGRECLVEIRRASRFDNLTIVIVSTANNPIEIQKLLHQGANLFIHKLQEFKAFKEQVIASVTKDWPLSHHRN